MRTHFEDALGSIGLSNEQIEEASLEGLDEALNKVNHEIKYPESGGLMPANPEAQMCIGVPMLLERKSMILRRICELRPQKQLGDLEEVIFRTVGDPEARQALLASIESTKKEQKAQGQFLRLQAEHTFQERLRTMAFAQGLSERKSAMHRKWLERESVASIIGALLLLSLGIALIIAMFTHTIASQIVTSSFLLILGYFFGQSGTIERQAGSVKRGKSFKQNTNIDS
jgi:hypothetical protein